MIYSRDVPGSPTNLPSDLDALFGDLFGQLFSGKYAADLSVDLKLTDAEATSGVTRDVVLQRPSACSDCDGRGSGNPSALREACKACNATGKRESTQGFFKVQVTCAACKGAGKTISEPCPTCTGTGRVSSEATVSVVVPPNIEHGQVIKLEGKGGLDDEGTRGLLYVFILVGDRPDPRAEAFAAMAQAQSVGSVQLPAAQLHRPPMPTWQVAALAVIVLAMIAALLLAR